MWTKIDGLGAAMRDILLAENNQLELVRNQTAAARQAEQIRNTQFEAATGVLDSVLRQVLEIQIDIKETLAKTTEINQIVLAQSQATKAAALQSQQAAQNAAGAANTAAQTAGSAAGAAARAAAASSHTGNVIASKVVTTSAKQQLEAQQRALQAKQAKLSRTIRQVKRRGPTLLQQIFQQ